MRQPTGYSQWFVEACARAARDAFKSMCQSCGAEPHFLYYKPHGLSIVVAPEHVKPEGHVVGCSDSMPGNLTVDQMTRWVSERAASLPVLPQDRP